MRILTVAVIVAAGLAVGYVVGRLLNMNAKCPASRRRMLVVLGGIVGLIAATSMPAASGDGTIQTISSAEELRAKLASSNIPVVVDFYADWCAPCHILAPIMEELAREWKGRVAFYKVDIDASPDISEQYSVRALPTLVYFRQDSEVRRTQGVLPKATMVRILESLTTAQPALASRRQPRVPLVAPFEVTLR